MNDHAATNEVKRVIQAYMDGTYQADGAKLESVFAPSAVMNGYLGPDLLAGTPAPFIEDMTSHPSMESQGDAYQAEIESIRIEGNVAAVVVSETGFRGDGTLVDFFHLLKTDDGWHIVSKLFTTL